MEGDAALGLGIFELVDARAVVIAHCCIGERPEVLGRLQLRGTGWHEEEVYLLGHLSSRARMPVWSIRHEDDLLVRAGADRLGEHFEVDLEQTYAHRRSQMEAGTPGRRMDKSDAVAPGNAVLHRRERTLAVAAYYNFTVAAASVLMARLPWERP